MSAKYRSKKNRRTPVGSQTGTSPVTPSAQADVSGGPFVLWGSSGYQAANTSPNRGYLYWPTTDTRRQMQHLTRDEILRRIQWLYAHFGFCRRIVNGMARLLGYVIPQPNSTDEEWNELAYDAIMGVMGNAMVWDAQGKFDGIIGQVQDNISVFRDGFCLGVLTETPTGRARVAYYEAHQIKNGPQCTAPQWHDGVYVGRNGQHVAYCIQDGEDPTKFEIIQAKDAIYFGRFENRGQVHSLSILVPAVLNMIDIVETRGAVKTAIKNHARLGTVIESDLPHTPAGPGGFGGPVQSATSVLPDGTEQPINFEVATQGVSRVPLQPGQRLKVIADDRPSQNFMEFERAVMADCLHACDLDYQTFADIGRVTGPGIRYLNSAIKRWVKIHRYNQVKNIHRLTVWLLAKEMKNGRLRAPRLQPGEQWWNRLEYIGLADMDIDGGRTAQATLTDLRSGQTTYLTELGARGVYWKRGIKQSIAETAFIEHECLKAETALNLPPGRLSPERVFPDRFTATSPLPVVDPAQVTADPDLTDPADEAEPA